MTDQQSIKGLQVPVGSFNLEVATLKQKLESKEQDFTELLSKYQMSVSERDLMEEQLSVMKEKAKESDAKLNEVKAETEAALRQNMSNEQELAIHRRRSLVGGGGPIITQMYETILLRYEELKTVHDELQRKMNEEVDLRSNLERELSRLRMQNQDGEKESLIQQNQALREQVEVLKRDMNRQVKDLNRIREERTSFKREYSLVMSERDAVHREMDKLQDDLTLKQKENENIESDRHRLGKENGKLKNQLANLQQGSASSLDYSTLQEELYAALQERKQALNEKDAKVHEAYTAQKAHKQAVERIESLSIEKDRLKSEVELIKQQLEEAIKEVKESTRWRELAFSERDKLNRQLDESRKACDKLTDERENLFKQLEEVVKELDSMKEAKKKLQIRLHEVQTRTDLRNLESTENAHSHDSAIDSGDWESEPTDQHHKLSHVKRMLPGQHDITIEPGIFIKHSNTPGVGVGDRILALGEVSVQNKSVRELNELLSRRNTLLLHLVKCVSLSKNSTSLSSSHDELNKNIPNGFSAVQPKSQPIGNNIWTGPDAKVILRNKKPTQAHLESPRHIKAMAFESPAKKVDKRESMIHHCEEDSQVSGHTVFSEPFYEAVKTEVAKPNTENLSSSHLGGKKKKPKMSSSRFWSRKKKTKSVSGASDLAESSNGTWPRLDSPSIANVLTGGGGGRFSVLMRKKNRPSLSPNTFTPPEGPSAGHTPPTPLRNPLVVSPAFPSSTMTSSPLSTPVVAEVTPLSSRDQSNGVAPRSRHQKATKKKPRPLSAPMGGTPGLSMWQHPVLIDSDVSNPEALPTPKQTVLVSPITSRATPSPSRPPRANVDQYDLTSTNPAPSPALPNRSSYLYHRQQSVPESNKLPLSLPTSCFSSSLTTSSVSTSTSRSRNAHSLPRPTSASNEPTFSISHNHHEPRKVRTMEYKRIRIPSEVSVVRMMSGSENSNRSIDRSASYLFPSVDPPSAPSNSARSTPYPESSISSLSVASSTPSTRSRKPPVTNDPRNITMVRGTEPIGISIVSGETGGIFVSRLTDNSLASKAGLEYGDQLLEFNGVNLRNAKETHARAIMSQTQPGDNIKFLVQYNLEKYKQSIESNLSDTLGISRPPPTNGPIVSEEPEEGTITPEATPRASPQVEETLRTQRMSEPRYVFMSDGCANVKLVGGNDVGIYVTSLVSNEETLTNKPSELKIGDKIIEFNSVSFSNITLESASHMLSQCTSGASFCVIYEPNRYKQIYGLPGDHFYVRTLFDHMVEHESALQFTRNSILLVENTYPDYVTGQWIASLVDEQGGRSTRGRIPSKITWEKERENLSHLSDDVTSTTGSASGKRLSGSGRRSFFKRLRPHRTSSRSSGDVRLHRSPSENSLDSTADIASESLGAYQVVEKHSASSRRPVVVFGPHAALVVEKLTREFAQQFVKCCLGSTIEMPKHSDIIQTYNYVTGVRVLTGDILKQTMNQFPTRHVLLDSSVEAIDRLHSIKVYPIIAFIKYSSAKKIKEGQDRVSGREKFTIKQCKEMLEKQSAIEQTLLSKYFGTVIINGGPASTVAVKVSKVVSHEHSKVLWLPSSTNLLNY